MNQNFIQYSSLALQTLFTFTIEQFKITHTMKTLKDLFVHQLKDIYSAEDQLVKALPEMAEKATDPELKKAFEEHLEETREHRNRIIDICEQLDVRYDDETCHAMEGLIKEAKAFMNEDVDDDVLNAGLIAEAQRVEHYEISAYGTVARFAKELGYHEIAQTLKATLEEEYDADEKLTTIAESKVNEEAKH